MGLQMQFCHSKVEKACVQKLQLDMLSLETRWVITELHFVCGLGDNWHTPLPPKAGWRDFYSAPPATGTNILAHGESQTCLSLSFSSRFCILSNIFGFHSFLRSVPIASPCVVFSLQSFFSCICVVSACLLS